MLWGDVELNKDGDDEYLEFKERATKTRKGDSKPRKFKPKIFACRDNPNCPVATI